MYYDLLPKIKNAVRAGKDKMVVPFSKMDFAVLKVLIEAGYVKSAEKEVIGRRTMITVRLTGSTKTKKDVVNDFKMISTPSRHLYMPYRTLRPVKQGHGVGVISTSKGILSDKEARKQKLGGEYLFELW